MNKKLKWIDTGIEKIQKDTEEIHTERVKIYTERWKIHTDTKMTGGKKENQVQKLKDTQVAVTDKEM